MCLAEGMASERERESSQSTDPGRFRVVVVTHDQTASRAVVAELDAREDIEIVNEVHDAVAATEAAVMTQLDFVLLDVDLPDLDDACRWITRHAAAVRIVLLRNRADSVSGARAVGTGSVAVPEPCSLEEFLASVQALRDGGTDLDPFAARLAIVMARQSTSSAGQAHPRLTDREWEVLQLRARGARLSELARHLYVSENTVRHHLLRIREKLLDGTSG
jgi:DNA-binding NarL/FixJ family response regulator